MAPDPSVAELDRPFGFMRTPPPVLIPVLAASITTLYRGGSTEPHVLRVGVGDTGPEGPIQLGIWNRDRVPPDRFHALLDVDRPQVGTAVVAGLSLRGGELAARVSARGVLRVRMMLWTTAECVTAEQDVFPGGFAGWVRVTLVDLHPEVTWAVRRTFTILLSSPVAEVWEQVAPPDDLARPGLSHGTTTSC